MPLTLVETAGSASANCYCTLAEAEAYVATLVWSTDWTGKTDEQKKAAIINAARMMSTIIWNGIRTNETQAMAWPRASGSNAPTFAGLTVATQGYLYDRDGYEVPSNTIPVVIKNANAEFALRLLGEDRAADSGGLAPETLKIGSLDLGKTRRRPIPASVLDMVRDFTNHSSGVVQGLRG
jgi:hypothetical protein